MKSIRPTVRARDEDEVLRVLSEEMPVGVCIMQDGKFCYVNTTFPMAIGYTVEELIGRDALEFVNPEDRDMVRENTIKMLKGELLSPYQFRVTHRDGSVVWVMATVKSIEYQGRRATLGNYMEMAGRKQMEEALKDSEERYRELADSITNVFFAMDDSLRCTYWNRASEVLTGIRADDAVGKSISEIFPDTPGTRQAELVYRNVLKTRKPQSLVTDYDINGRHYIFEISAYPSRSGLSAFVRDITEQRQAEEALKQSEERYRTILEETGDGYFEIDLAGNFTFVNDAQARLSGYSREEMIGMNFRAFTPEDRVKLVYEIYNRAYKTGEPIRNLPVETIRKDGTHGFAETSAFPIRNDKGEIIGFRGVRRDITERKKMEEALRQSEEKYRTILEEMEDAYFEVDLGGHFTFVNNAVCRDLGYSREELIGMSYKNFTAQEDIESVFAVFNEVHRTGVPNKGFSWKTIRKDGVEGFAETSVSLLRNEKGEAIGFRGIGRDVTKRKTMEEELKVLAEEWQKTFDSIAEAVSIHGADYRIRRANKAFADLVRMSPSEFIGKCCYEIIHGTQECVRHCPHQRTLATGNPSQAEFYEPKLAKYVSTSTSPIFGNNGKPVSTVHMMRDITRQREQNERLMIADRLASIGELAAGAAHELNNPLTSIVGFCQLLLEKEIPEDIREDIKLIDSQAQRAVNVTRNLLTFGRKQTPVKERTQINTIIEDVLRLRAYEHKANNIKVERRLDPDLPEALVDCFQMQQVFFNIVINAEYFMVRAHNRGTLVVTTTTQDDRIMISFADDGPGIPPEHLNQIFDPFFTTKPPGKGTGLGLSICHAIVSEHGGQIYAKSELGKGATIHIELSINGLDRAENMR